MVKDLGQPVPSGVPNDAHHATATALHSAAVKLLRHARTVDSRMDLDGPRASALSVLVFGGSLPIGRLAAIEQVTAPAITKTVTALEADGLVERVRSSSDRRVVVVRATAKGRALLERGRAARVRLIAELLDGISDSERRTLERASRIVASRLRGRGPGS